MDSPDPAAGASAAVAGPGAAPEQELTTLQEKALQDAGVGHGPPAKAEATPPAEPEKLVHNLDKALESLQSPHLSSISGSPILRLASLRIEGTKDLRAGFLLSVCRPYVDPEARTSPWSEVLYAHRLKYPRPAQATNLPSIIGLAQSLTADLAAFDLFKAVNAKLVPSETPLNSAEEDVDIVIECVKKSRVFLKTSTDVGNGEGTASIQGRCRNLFGGAETLEGGATFGTRTKQAFNLLFTSPILASPVLCGSLAASTTDRDLTAWSSCHEHTKSVRAAMLYTGMPFVQREFAAEVSWRHLNRMLPDASMSMRKLGGHSVKAALTHTWVRDTRDDPIRATVGSYFKAVQEFAGIGGDTNFIKAEFDAQRSRRIGDDWSWSLAGRAGLLRTLDGRPSLYSDRFHLGGPTSLRMFRLNSLGPKDGPDSLGGDAFWSAGLSVLAPIPRRPEWPLKLHWFLNAGQLCQMDQTRGLLDFTTRESLKPPVNNLAELLRPSTSTGVGLVYSQGALRVELNAGVPLTARRGDGVRKGLQIGLGVSFL